MGPRVKIINSLKTINSSQTISFTSLSISLVVVCLLGQLWERLHRLTRQNPVPPVRSCSALTRS